MKTNNFVKKIFGFNFWGTVTFLVVWQLLYWLINNNTFVSPYETFKFMLSGTMPKELLLHSLTSMYRVVVSVLISLAIGLPIGIILGVNKFVQKLFYPLLYILYPIPKIAFMPVFMLLFGLGDLSKISLTIWIIVFQIIISVRDGIIQIPNIYFKVMDGFSASTIQKYIHLIIPAILPNLFTALRLSFGMALTTLFFTENYATRYGVGYMIQSSWANMNYSKMFAGIITLSIVGMILFKILDIIEVACTPWCNHTK